MTLKKWLEELHICDVKQVDLVLLVIKCNVRPSDQDKFNVIVLKNIIKDLESENLGIVITFSESAELYKDKDMTVKWINTLLEGVGEDGLKKLQNVFWFCGTAGSWAKPTGELDEDGDPVTTPVARAKTKGEEIRDWLAQVCPVSQSKEIDQHVQAINIEEDVQARGSKELVTLLNNKIDNLWE